MPEVVRLAQILEQSGWNSNARLTSGQRFQEGIQSGWLTILLDDMASTANEGDEFGGQRLSLIVVKDCPDTREQFQPQLFSQLRVHVTKLGGCIDKINCFSLFHRVKELVLSNHKVKKPIT